VGSELTPPFCVVFGFLIFLLLFTSVGFIITDIRVIINISNLEIWRKKKDEELPDQSLFFICPTRQDDNIALQARNQYD